MNHKNGGNARRLKQVAIALGIGLCGLAISMPGALVSEPIWPDGQRYAFNGILVHDLIREGGILQPYEYARQFYAQYPATNLPYGPVVYALLLAISFFFFGISYFSARLVTVFFTCAAAGMCYVLFSRRFKNPLYGLAATAAFLFNPLTGVSARDVLPGTAVAFWAFLTLYLSWRYLEERKAGCGIGAAVAFSLGCLTKQYLLPLGPAILVYALVTRNWPVFAKKETGIAIVLSLLLITPPTILAFIFARNELGPRTYPPIGLDLLAGYPLMSFRQIPLITVLAAAGCVAGLLKKDRFVLLSFLWGMCALVFFTIRFREHQEINYFYSFFPALLAPFLYAFRGVLQRAGGKRVSIVICLAAGAGFAYSAWAAPFHVSYGYGQAGEFVADHIRGRTVLFYGHNDGSFMMGIRRKRADRGFYVLRGDRHLSIRMAYGDIEEKTVIGTEEELLHFLNVNKTGIVVVERGSNKAMAFEEYRLLLKTLERSRLFTPIGSFPLHANYKTEARELRVYEFRFDEAIPEAETLNVTIPTTGMRYTVPLNRSRSG